MAARATAAQAGAEPDEQTGDRRQHEPKTRATLVDARDGLPREAGRNESGYEARAPGRVARDARHEAVQDAAHAGDAAVRGEQPDARQADEDPAGEGGEGVK